MSYQYWPSDDQCCYGDIMVRANGNIELPNFIIRGFKVFNVSNYYETLHHHYMYFY